MKSTAIHHHTFDARVDDYKVELKGAFEGKYMARVITSTDQLISFMAWTKKENQRVENPDLLERIKEVICDEYSPCINCHEKLTEENYDGNRQTLCNNCLYEV